MSAVGHMREHKTTLPAAVIGLANAVMANVTAFGVQLTAEQQGAIIGGVNALMVLLVVAWATRNHRGKGSPDG